jgi:aromatic ring-cleaving dioxygenase
VRCAQQAGAVFNRFRLVLGSAQIAHTRPLVFEVPESPWPSPMWQVLLPQSDRVHVNLQRCIAWLLDHRGELSVMIHPNTRQENGRGGMVADHSVHAVWPGSSIPLRLSAFEGIESCPSVNLKP